MKHSEVDRAPVINVARWLGLSLGNRQWSLLEEYAGWLREEALDAGGLGPHETKQIWDRHLADSLAFARGWKGRSPPSRLLDVGAGVGLPGIPLAILWPETNITLLDRSVRRCDLARRAARLLELSNLQVRQGDAWSEPREWEAAVFRAVLAPDRALAAADRLLLPDGTAVIGLRGNLELPAKPPRTTSLVLVPPTILDGRVGLLIMDACEQ